MSSPHSSPTDYGTSSERGSALTAPPKRVHHARRFRPTSTGSTTFTGASSVTSGASQTSPSASFDGSSMSTVLPHDTSSLLGGHGGNSQMPPSAGGNGTFGTQSQSVMLMDNPANTLDDRSSLLLSSMSTPISAPLSSSRPVSQLDQPPSALAPPAPTTQSSGQFSRNTVTVSTSSNPRTSALSPSTRQSAVPPNTRTSTASSQGNSGSANAIRAARHNARQQLLAEEERNAPRQMGTQNFIGSCFFIIGYALMHLAYNRWGLVAEVQRLQQSIYVNPLYKWVVVALVTTVLCLIVTFLCVCLMSARRAYFLGTRATFTYGFPAGMLLGLYMTVQYLPGGTSYVYSGMSFEISLARVGNILVTGGLVFLVHGCFYNKTKYRPLLTAACVIPFLTAAVSCILGDHRQLDHWDQLVAKEKARNQTQEWLWFSIYVGAYVCMGGSFVIVNAFLRKTTSVTEEDDATTEAVSTLGYHAVATNYLLGGGTAAYHRRRFNARHDEKPEPFFPKSHWIVTVAAFAGSYSFFFGLTLLATTMMWDTDFFGGASRASSLNEAYTHLLNGGRCLGSEFQGRDFCYFFLNYMLTIAVGGLLQLLGIVMVCLSSPVQNVYNLLVAIPLTSVLTQKWTLWRPADGSSLVESGDSILIGQGNSTTLKVAMPIDYGYEGPALAFCLLAAITHFVWQYKMATVEEGPPADVLSPLEGIGAQIDGARPQDNGQP